MNVEKAKSTTRYSRQRESILRILSETDTHPTANYVYEKLRQEIPNVSLGTVYRNLSKLSNDGSIIKIPSDTSSERYDARTTPHYHITCTKCGSVADVFISYQSNVDKQAEKIYDGKITGHNIMFSGVCKNCLLKESK